MPPLVEMPYLTDLLVLPSNVESQIDHLRRDEDQLVYENLH